jgi:hypothetical protein
MKPPGVGRLSLENTILHRVTVGGYRHLMIMGWHRKIVIMPRNCHVMRVAGYGKRVFMRSCRNSVRMWGKLY